jgi:cobalamin biosynthesis protein CobT
MIFPRRDYLQATLVPVIAAVIVVVVVAHFRLLAVGILVDVVRVLGRNVATARAEEVSS